MSNKELLKEMLEVMLEPGGFCLSAITAVVLIILLKIVLVIIN